MGTIHVAFGASSGIGGTIGAGVHLDGVVKAPSLWLDDRLAMEAGRILCEE